MSAWLFLLVIPAVVGGGVLCVLKDSQRREAATIEAGDEWRRERESAHYK